MAKEVYGKEQDAALACCAMAAPQALEVRYIRGLAARFNGNTMPAETRKDLIAVIESKTTTIQ